MTDDIQKRDSFADAVRKAMEEKIIPAFFTEAERAEMAQPWHSKWDHVHCSLNVTGEKAFAPFFGIAPQMFIEDPRISDERVAAAPKAVQVDFDGQSYDVPLRFEKSRRAQREDVQHWLDRQEGLYATRAAEANLCTSLLKTFNMVAGQDYSFGHSATKDATTYHIQWHPQPSTVQAFNKSVSPALAGTSLSSDTLLKDAAKKHIEDELKKLDPQRKSTVRLVGRISAL